MSPWGFSIHPPTPISRVLLDVPMSLFYGMWLSFWLICELWGLPARRKTKNGCWYSLGVIWDHNIRTNPWPARRPLRGTWLWHRSFLRKTRRGSSLMHSHRCPWAPRYIPHTDCKPNSIVLPDGLNSLGWRFKGLQVSFQQLPAT